MTGMREVRLLSFRMRGVSSRRFIHNGAEAISDVVIVGGGVIGSSCAYFLASSGLIDPKRIKVFERDSTYTFASSARSASSIRQQFSTKENIEISQFGEYFIKNAPELLKLDDALEDPIDLCFVEQGYLFLRSEQDDKDSIHASLSLQQSLGASIEFLDPCSLTHTFPWMNVEDLYGGTFGRQGEGWFDAYALMMGFRRKARELGVEYIEEEVVGINCSLGRVQSVETSTGQVMNCGALVNAAGPRSDIIARLAGLDEKQFPVVPKKRSVFGFKVEDCPDSLHKAPLVIDPSGVYFRPDQDQFICGCSPQKGEDDPRAEYDEEEADDELWEEVVWPTIAERVPAFERVRLTSSWAGLYSVNEYDHNALVGTQSNLENLFYANGFSGHGLQQAPAVGRGISELICFGSYQTIDLTNLGFERLASQENKKQEVNVV